MAANNIRFIERRVLENNIGIPRIGAVREKENGMLYYKGRHFKKFEFPELGTNYRCIETEEFYLIKDCNPHGKDAIMNAHSNVMVDEDIQDFYWKNIRKKVG